MREKLHLPGSAITETCRAMSRAQRPDRFYSAQKQPKHALPDKSKVWATADAALGMRYAAGPRSSSVRRVNLGQSWLCPVTFALIGGSPKIRPLARLGPVR